MKIAQNLFDVNDQDGLLYIIDIIQDGRYWDATNKTMMDLRNHSKQKMDQIDIILHYYF